MSTKVIRLQAAMHGLPPSRHASKARHGKTRPFQAGRELLPEKGVLLDCIAGSGTILAAGLGNGASQVK
jgi:hypothetical protein